MMAKAHTGFGQKTECQIARFFYVIMIFFSNIYTIGLGTSFDNFLLPLHTNTIIT